MLRNYNHFKRTHRMMMPGKLFGLVLALGFCTNLLAQEELPELRLQQATIESQLRFLASDALEGRRTGTKGNEIAANFIAAHLEAYGFEPPAGQDTYFQDVPFQTIGLPDEVLLTVGDATYDTEAIAMIFGEAIDQAVSLRFVGFGWVDEATGHNDYANIDVEGKMVVTLSGTPEDRSPQGTIGAAARKRQLAAEKGAIGLIELYQLPFPFSAFKNFFGGGIQLADPDMEPLPQPYGFINLDREDALIKQLQAGEALSATFTMSPAKTRLFTSPNVIGVLAGSDPELKDEYLLLTAHFDHVGMGGRGGRTTPTDSIFNGARDNAFGTISLLAAAKALSEKRPKRSVIALAVTAEEEGLLGSAYYAENPLIPLNQVIFNLNTDGAGYNTTEAVSILGYGRTGTDALMQQAVEPFELDIIENPAKEQGLFDRSDNVSFAKKGVPCLTFSPGFAAFDQEIFQYYHQITDEADSLDFDYVTRFAKSYAHFARLVADSTEKPFWVADDKYEAVGKALYNR